MIESVGWHTSCSQWLILNKILEKKNNKHKQLRGFLGINPESAGPDYNPSCSKSSTLPPYFTKNMNRFLTATSEMTKSADRIKTAGRCFSRPASSASVLPSITLWCLLILEHACAAKAQQNAMSAHGRTGVRKRHHASLVLQVTTAFGVRSFHKEHLLS